MLILSLNYIQSLLSILSIDREVSDELRHLEMSGVESVLLTFLQLTDVAYG